MADGIGQHHHIRCGPFDTDHIRDPAELFDKIHAAGIIAQIQHDRQAVACFCHTGGIFEHTARGAERVGRLVDHQGIHPITLGRAGQNTGLFERAADTGGHKGLTVDQGWHGSLHGARFLEGQRIEFAGIAVDGQGLDACCGGARDDRGQTVGGNMAVAVIGSDKDTGNPAQGGNISGGMGHDGNLLGCVRTRAVCKAA